MQTKTFEVPSISCGHCVMAIENEVSELDGVTSIKADKDTRQVVVEWNEPASWDKIKALLVEINYPAAE